ncbi:hypothetical protein K492DRAFT_234912 [Lichtheimia hyalospora FSU 10163]|nr:hypothetical protein K492DRAFT_234912 [Lichtheimia hyalospora FSU 10163]
MNIYDHNNQYSGASILFKSASNSSNLSHLPVELIDMVLSHLDTSALFRLCHVNQYLRTLAQPRLFHHAQQVTMRLWICQPHVVSHKPIDFVWSHCDSEHNRMVFIPQQDEAVLPLQPALPPPQIDGCTVLFKVGNSKRIYSISYKNRVVSVPVDIEENEVVYKGDTDNDHDLSYTCGWKLRYNVQQQQQQQRKAVVPCSFECDMDLLDPQVLSSPTPIPPSDKIGPEHALPSSHYPIEENKKQQADPFSRILPNLFIAHA